MNKKYALVLSGGGFKGAYQLGALRYIRENWQGITGREEPMRFDVIAGVSAGALNGALIASGHFDELEDLWRRVYQNGGREIYHSGYIDNDGKIRLRFEQLKNDLLPNFKVNAGLITKSVWNSVRSVFSKKIPGLVNTLLQAAEKDFDANFKQFKSLADNKPLEEKLKQYVRLTDIPESTTFLCGLVSINDGLYYSLSNKTFTDNTDFVQAILASSAMPVIWQPVPLIRVQETGQVIKNAVDGGIRNTSPLKDVVDFINRDPDNLPYEVFIINCNSGYISPMEEQWNIGDIALRTLTEITLAEIFNDDVRSFLKMNDFARQASGVNVSLTWKEETIKYFDFQLIQPTGSELGDTLDSRSGTISNREVLGYEHARKAFSGTSA